MRVRCDVFCRVIDNFGDAAVAWRLARILALEHDYTVRLLVDRPDVLQRLLGGERAASSPLQVDGVSILPFDHRIASPAELLVETFGCGLPEGYPLRDARQPGAQALINVEYLSAEDWPDAVHGLSSPARSNYPERHFFFPGFTDATGGLLRERDLARRRDSALADPNWRADWFKQQGVDFDPASLVVSLFCYDRAFADDFFEQLSAILDRPLHLILAEGTLSAAVRRFCGDSRAGVSKSQNQLRVSVLRFLPQLEFDALLWACDGNVVRGEDSFVRAQLARRPMLWDIYPQDDNAHLAKLDAFVKRYATGWPNALKEHYAKQANALVERDPRLVHSCFKAWCDELSALAPWATRWCGKLEALPELGTELAIFAGKLLK